MLFVASITDGEYMNDIDFAANYGQKRLETGSDTVEVLVAIIIGVIGMTVSITGFTAEDPLVYTLSIIIMVLSAGWIGMKFLNAVWDFKDCLKNKDQS